MIVAWLSCETSPSEPESRYVRALASAVISSSARKSRTNASNSGESTVCVSERMTTTSLTAAGSAGNAANRFSSARSDCGLFVGLPSLVRLPPRSAMTAAIASTKTATQAEITRHGCLALAEASVLVEAIIAVSASL
jgi:hypothetical protein